MADLILALDLPKATEALALVDRLPGLRWVKLGPILMTREGPDLVRTFLERGLRVFLDLKWHDIPNTVAGAVTAARDMGVSMATVHILGGRAMLDAAVLAAGPDLALVGVTVLTSQNESAYAQALGRADVSLPAEVERLALVGAEAGLRGVVCSPQEVSLLRRRLGAELYIVVPGIRSGSDPVADQARVATAGEAAHNGATHLVVGRPILASSHPPAALERLMKEAQCTNS
jgi:orotidine-5'-phosphate decarboxylase